MDKLMDVVMLTVHSPLIVAPLNGKEIYARDQCLWCCHNLR